jgi:hypothetical protein
MPYETLTTLEAAMFREGANSCSFTIMMQISQNINFNTNHQYNLSPLTKKVRGDFFLQ